MGDQLEKLAPIPQSCTHLARDSEETRRSGGPSDCPTSSDGRPASEGAVCRSHVWHPTLTFAVRWQRPPPCLPSGQP